jgi:16S rRNA (guanine527-N7)-methyltransferase
LNDKILIDIFSRINILPSEKQINQYIEYMNELISWNQKFNLTAITEEKSIVIKHFYDSLLGLKVCTWLDGEEILDMGTGAGFPGIPLKIIHPSIKLTLVDSVEKKVGFLQHIINTIKLEDTKAVHARAEDLGQNKDFRGNYDKVVSRALAKLPVLVEYCLPFVKLGGIFLAYKGPEVSSECLEGKKAICELGGEVVDIKKFILPEEMSERNIISIKKIKETPNKYPRKAGTPNKKPL